MAHTKSFSTWPTISATAIFGYPTIVPNFPVGFIHNGFRSNATGKNLEVTADNSEWIEHSSDFVTPTWIES